MHVLLLLPFLALAAVQANASECASECASALQLQDTVRSSLRSEENKEGLLVLEASSQRLGIRQPESLVAKSMANLDKAVAEQKVTLDKALVEQKYAAEKAIAEQKSAVDRALADQKSAGEKVVAKQKVTLDKALVEQKYAADNANVASAMQFAALFAVLAFLFFNPQRAIAMLRAYIGPQHAPP